MAAFALLIISIFLATLYHSYFSVSAHKIARQRAFSAVAQNYYAARLMLLALLVGLFILEIIFAARQYDFIITVLISVGCVVITLAATRFSNPFAEWMAPYIGKVVGPFNRFFKNAGKQSAVSDSSDLKDFLRDQKKAPNNTIDAHILSGLSKRLAFDSKIISDHMVTLDKIHFVKATDSIGPILLSELHATGYNCFPVKSDSDEIIGMLHLSRLAEHIGGGLVSAAMDTSVQFIVGDHALPYVLEEFDATGHRVFMVTDSDGVTAGLISVNDVMGELV